VPVKPPATPSPAATLVLLRDRPDRAVELLLIQRHRASKFAGGDHVFPGGKVDAIVDAPVDAGRWCAGLDPKEAGRVLGLAPELAPAYWTGVIRETFEEVGVLLAYQRGGAFVNPEGAAFERYRDACQNDSGAFWDMVRAEKLTLATDRLAYIAHWITPEESPLRFDTRFFAAPVPPGQEARADGREITSLLWLTPAEALDAADRGQISLRNPTRQNIKLFEGATSAAEALRAVEGRTITTIRPRVVMDGDVRRVLMPGDPGYF
jgi:8-oxo-dGTP pyrophosphatase MutT (NUDIX family)